MRMEIATNQRFMNPIRFLSLFLVSLLSFSALQGSAQDGAAIFQANCTQCHKINEKYVGPALRDVHKKHDEAYLLKWIRNSQGVIKAGDPYAVALYKEYSETVMPAFDLPDGDIKAVIAYIKTESEKPVVAAGAAAGGDGENLVYETEPAAWYTQFSTGQWLGIAGGLFALVVVLALVSRTLKGTYTKRVAGGELDPNHETPFLSRFNPKVVSLLVATLLIGAFSWYSTVQMLNTGVQQNYKPTQPIAYSHKLHAGKYKIQCSYCHTGVERWKSATIPATNICMNCHNVIKKESPEIQKIYAARQNNTPIQWVRIHNLPDHVYFNHYAAL